jgi:peptidylprolyl isomerase
VRLSRLTVLAVAVLPLALLAGCGSANGQAAPANVLDVIAVGGARETPVVSFKAPFRVAVTTSKVITVGKGATLSSTNLATLNYVLFNGENGRQVDTTFGTGTVSMNLGSATLFPGLKKTLIGAKIGSRLLVAIPPADAFSGHGDSAGFGPEDTLVYFLDLVSAGVPLSAATGTAVPPVPGLPTAIVEGGQPARITVPKTVAPTRLIVQPLIKGGGAVVKKGNSIKLSYTGVLWRNGERFGASVDLGGPRNTVIGRGNVISGWDRGLVGQTVGSRILLVVPPADGFGAKGVPPQIGAQDTLVFVIDILAVN